MADDYVTKKDFETLTQKVTVSNSQELAKPLIEQQKKNDLKELEQSIEQKALFQNIADGIKGIGSSLLDGLKGLIPKTDGGLSKLLGLGFGLLLAPFASFIGFLGQLGRDLNFLTSKLGKFITGIVSKLKNSKLFKSISGLFQKVFSGKSSFFSKLSNIFKSIVKFATGGPFKAIMKFAGSIGRILGKVFLPITVLLGIFDFVRGFMKGYSEGGIIEGIKGGFSLLFDGLIGNLIKLLGKIPEKIAGFLGLDNVAAAIGPAIDGLLEDVKGVFGGLFDIIIGIFTFDGDTFKNGLSSIWDGIVGITLAPFKMIGNLVKDIFGGTALLRAELMLKNIGLSIASFFMFLQETFLSMIKKVTDLLPDWALPDGLLKMVDNLSEGTKQAKMAVDNQKKEIENKQRLIAKQIKLEELKEKRKADREAEEARMRGSSNGAGSTLNNQTNTTTNNNVSYNVYGNTTELSGEALGHMTS